MTVTNTVDATVSNTVNTTVSNTVNTHVVNVIPFDSVRGLGAASGLSPPGSLTFVELLPGRLHALNVSVAAPPGADNYCWVRVSLILNPGGPQPDERSLAAVVARDGNSTAVANDYASPIEVLFDPTAGDTAYLRANVTGQVQPGQTCMLSLGGVYQEDGG
ncbi:MAG TPA: hypothetical protein VLM41_10355 [Steroidobacteraceae bacterium]|nr:hypothetical protein [Steroidobacteraceae bacterium]